MAGLLAFEFSVNAKVFFRYLYALKDLGRQRLRLSGCDGGVGGGQSAIARPVRNSA